MRSFLLLVGEIMSQSCEVAYHSCGSEDTSAYADIALRLSQLKTGIICPKKWGMIEDCSWENAVAECRWSKNTEGGEEAPKFDGRRIQRGEGK